MASVLALGTVLGMLGEEKVARVAGGLGQVNADNSLGTLGTPVLGTHVLGQLMLPALRGRHFQGTRRLNN